MQKLIALIAIGFGAITFASCSNKDYNCICYGGIAGGKATMIVSKPSKAKAEDKCASYNSPAGTADGYSGCHIE